MSKIMHYIVFLIFTLNHVSAEEKILGDAFQDSVPWDISSYLTPIINEYNIPGMVAAVIRVKGPLAGIATGAAGVRMKGKKEAVTLSDPFHLGSCTKAMTATLCALMVEKGYLKWDDRVVDLVPDLASKIHADYRSLTIKQLLNHRGGLPADLSNIPNLEPGVQHYWQVQNSVPGNNVEGRKIVLEQALSHASAVKPGTFHYSNLSYIIVGHILELLRSQKSCDLPWEKMISEDLFIPLEMKSGGFGPPKETDNENPQVPHGHDKSGNPLGTGPEADNPALLGPAGTVHASIMDWARFVLLHLSAQKENYKMLSAKSYKMLHTPVTDSDENNSYAMGWFVHPNKLEHNGSNGSWYCWVRIIPKDSKAILVACNFAGPKVGEACEKVITNLSEEPLQYAQFGEIGD